MPAPTMHTSTRRSWLRGGLDAVLGAVAVQIDSWRGMVSSVERWLVTPCSKNRSPLRLRQRRGPMLKIVMAGIALAASCAQAAPVKTDYQIDGTDPGVRLFVRQKM